MKNKKYKLDELIEKPSFEEKIRFKNLSLKLEKFIFVLKNNFLNLNKNNEINNIIFNLINSKIESEEIKDLKFSFNKVFFKIKNKNNDKKNS